MCLDVVCGEPPQRLHPVVWLGNAITFLESRAPASDPARFAYGTTVALILPLVAALLGYALERRLPWPVRAVLLKPTFAGKTLLDSAARVECSLATNRLTQAQADLRWLVSRPTHALDPSLVAAAAIESLAENAVDSWLAPLLAYGVFGVSGAYAYRAANTADAMWGYHTPTYEWLGKTAARLDDALNFIPARVAAPLLACVSPHPGSAVRIWRRDAARTTSPNAGQPMAAAAGALQLRLEKPDHYILHAEARRPTADDISSARHLVARAMLLGLGIALLVRKIRANG